jgi:hypothetical protein
MALREQGAASQLTNKDPEENDVPQPLHSKSFKNPETTSFLLRAQQQDQLSAFKSKRARPMMDGALSPNHLDYRSEAASGRDSYYVANAMGVRPFKVSETPQMPPSDLTNYLNWVPTKEKVSLP